VSSYQRVIIYVFLIFFISGCNELRIPDENKTVIYNPNYKSFAQENEYIIFALEYDRIGQKANARELYSELYKNTLKEEYLLQYSRLSFTLKKYKDIISIVEKNDKIIIKDKDKIEKIYILSLVQNKEYDKALRLINNLIEIEKSNENYELLGNLYLQKGDYNKAKDVFDNIYKKSPSPKSIINLVDIMYLYLDKKDEAIKFLESYTKKNGCNNLICSKLLSYYQEEKNIDGVISVLKKSYYTFRENGNDFTKDKIYKLLMYYLVKKDINEAIEFLEKSNADDDKLLTLYRNNGQYEHAYKLAKKLYEKSSNIDYLAQIAILEFEKASDKKKILKSVIKTFEDVLTVLDNHIYQNYLGYILIDYDVDVKKGLMYVNKALEKAPNNLAYIDSLAWGQYKLKDCKNAYINMKKVVDGTGLNDEEIKDHWNKIKECNK